LLVSEAPMYVGACTLDVPCTLNHDNQPLHAMLAVETSRAALNLAFSMACDVRARAREREREKEREGGGVRERERE